MAPGGTIAPLSCGGGSSSLAECDLEIVCGVDDFAWLKTDAMVEDGWTIVKGKKVKPSIPSFDMSSRSQKMGSKGKFGGSVFFSY